MKKVQNTKNPSHINPLPLLREGGTGQFRFSPETWYVNWHFDRAS
jgi:hypothetical protein